jgi:hypothetical protein
MYVDGGFNMCSVDSGGLLSVVYKVGLKGIVV